MYSYSFWTSLMIIKAIKSILDYLNIINNITVPTGNLGVSRSSMPQIAASDQSDYLKWLLAKGIKSKVMTVHANTLRLAQNEVNKEKVIQMMHQLQSKNTFSNPIIVSSDNFVIDGSHRLVAQMNKDKYSNIKIIHVDMPAMPLLTLSRGYGKASFRTVSGAKIGT